MAENVEQLWDAISRIGSEDATAAMIAPAVVAKLIQFKLVELKATGLPQLTARGERAYVALESGDGAGDFPELEESGGYA
jgi:hypothetical protein